MYERELGVTRRRITLIVTFSLVLLGQLQLVAQEKPPASEQEKRAIAEGQTREKQAALRAEAQKKRDAAIVEAQAKTAAAEAKQAMAKAKAAEKQAAIEIKRSIDQIRRTMPPDVFKLLGDRLNLNAASVVKGAPYSATAITESIQTLGDGNQIIQRNEAAYYRDREGRTRIDQTLKSIGKWTVAGDPARIITISDPVAGHYYSLNPREQTALIDPGGPPKKIPLSGGPKKSTPAPDSSDHPKPKGPKVSDKTKSAPVTTDSSDGRKKESLGTKTIEGVSADGMRTTRIIPAGEIGNVRPIEIVDESWYSPELQMLLMTKHNDPRSGETSYRLTNIKRSDPEPSLFEIPPGYRMLDKAMPKPPSPPPGPPNMAKPAKKTEVIY